MAAAPGAMKAIILYFAALKGCTPALPPAMLLSFLPLFIYLFISVGGEGERVVSALLVS